jgi:predicted nucleotidyltransferase component of viral defense system
LSLGRHRPNLAASVRARLLDLSRQRQVEFQLLLAEFAIERLLYRLGISTHADRFVLKGAMLFRLWPSDHRRASWDLDLLGRGPSAVDEVVVAVRDLCAIGDDDGLVFVATSITAEETRIADGYAGVRVRLEARLVDARIPVQVDIGFGDAVVPAPVRTQYPVLLDHTPPSVLVYPRETVVAEKLEAIVSLGVTNSRMKDFYDLHVLASFSAFEGTALVRAVQATFTRRGTALPTDEPVALSRAFLSAPTWSHGGAMFGCPTSAPSSSSCRTSAGHRKRHGSCPMNRRQSIRCHAIRGPVLTTMESATAEEDVGLDFRVLGAQVHQGHADARQGQQEVDAPLAAQPSGLARCEPPEFVELGGKKEARLGVKLLLGHGG